MYLIFRVWTAENDSDVFFSKRITKTFFNDEVGYQTETKLYLLSDFNLRKNGTYVLENEKS